MSDELLKSFILYTQAIEAVYHDWKQYWLDYYMNNKEPKDLYNPEYINTLWLKNQKPLKY